MKYLGYYLKEMLFAKNRKVLTNCLPKVFLQLIGRDNARFERSAGQQLEPEFLAAVEYRFSTAQDDRINCRAPDIYV